MSYRFSKTRPEFGEIVEPDDLNQNLKEFVDEINGNLTNENLELRENRRLQPSQFKNETFCEVFQSSRYATKSWKGGGAAFQTSKNTTGYISIDEFDSTMPNVEFIAERDGWVIFDFNASHNWEGTGLISADEALRKLMVREHWPIKHYTRLAMHNNTLPVGGWIGITCRDEEEMGIKGSGSINHRTSSGGAEFSFLLPLYDRDFPQGKYMLQTTDRYGIRYRVTLNGAEVAETGWQFNGKDRNGVYLCGVMPVRAGRNVVKTEVSVANVENIWGVAQGIRSEAEDGGKKGKFFPKSFVSSQDSLSPLPGRRTVEISKGTDDLIHAKKKLGHEPNKVKLGISCWVGAANLVLQYRKG